MIIARYRTQLFRILLLTPSLLLIQPGKTQAELSTAVISYIASSNFAGLSAVARCGMFAEKKLCTQCKIKKDPKRIPDEETKKEIPLTK